MKIKPTIFNLSAILFFLLSADPTSAVTFGSNAKATVSVHIVRPLLVASNSDLTSSGITSGQAPGVIVFRQDGKRDISGGVFVESDSFFTPASFVAKGEPNGKFAVTLPDTITMTDRSGNSMTVDGFTSRSGETVSFDANGQKEIKVGANLHINPEQPVGQYSGELTILINYE